jgi:hypothetical protein
MTRRIERWMIVRKMKTWMMIGKKEVDDNEKNEGVELMISKMKR